MIRFITLCGAAAFAASSSFANTVVAINVDAMVTQEIITLQGHPDFEDVFQDNPFIFFEEHLRILNDEANVWDPSGIPSQPDPNGYNEEFGFGRDYGVVSQGQLDAIWTFDASVLQQDLTGFDNFEGTVLEGGNTAQTSEFQVMALGNEVENGTADFSQVIVANDIPAEFLGLAPPQPFEGEFDVENDIQFENQNPFALDVIAIQAGNSDDPGDDGDGNPSFVTLLLAGPSNWFENTQEGDIPDFNEVQLAGVDYRQVVSAEDGTQLFEESITGEVTSFGVTVFDGQTEDTALLPGGVNAAGGFEFELIEIEDEDLIFIDPDIAVGYTYELTGDGEILAIVAPSFATVADSDQEYTIVYFDGVSDQTMTIKSGEEIALAAGTAGYEIKSITLTGIDVDLMLDPNDTMAFVTGFRFSGLGANSVITQTPITEYVDPNVAAVPLPAGAWLLMAGLGGLGAVSRRRKAARAA